MPSPERIEQLHHQLVPLGDEPAVAAARGEIIEPPPRPESNLDDDLSALLDDAELDSETFAAPSDEAATDSGEFDESEADTAALLSNLDTLFDDEEPSEEEEPAADDDDPFAGFDLGDDDILAAFDGETEAEAEAEAETEAEAEAEAETEAETEAEADGEADATAEPADVAGDLADVASDLAGDLAEPDILDTPDIPDIPDMPDFDIPDFEELAEADFAQAEEAGLTGVDDGIDEEPEAEPEEVPPSEDDIFGSSFGDQFDADFGDIDLDDALDSDALDGDAFELPEVDDELDALGDEGFSLGDFGEEFDITGESIDEFAGLDVDTGGIEIDGDEIEEVALAPETETGIPPERELSDTEFTRLQKTLGSLPLNVKIAAQQFVADAKGTPSDINELIDLLIAGATPVAVADLLSRALDTQIIVPKGYQKKTGLAFEAEKRSLGYQLRYVVLPVVRTAVIVTVVAAIVGLLAYRFIYRPVYAAVLYRQGYELAEIDRYEAANETFQRAYELLPRDKWFQRYAELYVQKYQYQLAVEKYDQLVFGMDPARRNRLIEIVRNGDLGVSRPIDDKNRRMTFFEVLNVNKEAILAHGKLQSETLANYRRADELYSILLHADEYDYEALLARGDNFMRWADENRDYYEKARLAYADLLSHYGDTDEILMRFLRYFVRTDNEKRVDELVRIFERVSPQAEIDPVIYAEAAGYLLDKGRITGIRDMLFRAYKDNPLVPEVHYHLARYNAITNSPVEERSALDNAIAAFEVSEPLSQRRLVMSIDTYIRSGEYWYDREELLTAREDFAEALRRYEEAKAEAFLAPDEKLARVYARLGDIQYYHGRDYDRALDRYNSAVLDGYETDDLNYKRGFIHYRNGNYDRATRLFFSIGSISEIFGLNNNVMYARANTLYQRGNYVAAEALYAELADRLNQERARIRTLLVDEDSAHRALIENMVRVYNNLGITRFRMGETVSGRSDENPQLSRALANLEMSTELSVNYLRDYETGQRALATDLAFLNIREILYPNTGGFEPTIYEELPRDAEQELW